MIDSTPTQPIRPRRIARPPKGRSCFEQVIIGLLMLTVCTVSTCSSLLIGYAVLPQPPLTILIMGLDSRDGDGVATRSDTIMLVGAKRFELNVASIPRDVFIRVPGYGNPQRINTVNALGELPGGIGGAQLLRQSIDLSFGVEPTHYVRLDFDAFRRMIDAVGGVTIDVAYPINDFAYPTDDGGTMVVRFEPGRQRMDGERALIYARTRNQDDDYRRAERQQQVLNAFAAKAANPLWWPRLLVVLVDSVETDLSPIALLRALPSVAFGIGRADNFVLNRDYVLPGAGGVVPDYERVRPIFAEMFGR